jgi:hypothetical protein
MYDFEVLLDPGDEMVLECALDYLVEEIGGEKLMNVSAWKAICKRL